MFTSGSLAVIASCFIVKNYHIWREISELRNYFLRRASNLDRQIRRWRRKREIEKQSKVNQQRSAPENLHNSKVRLWLSGAARARNFTAIPFGSLRRRTKNRDKKAIPRKAWKISRIFMFSWMSSTLSREDDGSLFELVSFQLAGWTLETISYAN